MNIPENSNTASPSVPAGGDVDWESRYVAGDTPWDKGIPHPALRVLLSGLKVGPRILVPGCGTGQDVREIARQTGAEVVGMDIAPSAIERASRHSPIGREKYVLGDFLAGEAARFGAFDTLFEHTCFCAIPPRRRIDYARAAAASLKPGGLLLGVFFGNPDNPDPLSPPFRCPPDEIDRLFSAYFEKLESPRVFECHAGREGREYLRIFRRGAP